MTRQEATKVFEEIKVNYDSDPDWGVYDGVFSRRNLTEILDAYTALRGPTPDPITGLVPCGCGGQAVFEGSFLDEEVPSSYRVSLSCIECGISTIAYEYEQEAMKAWNTAMGRKGGVE